MKKILALGLSVALVLVMGISANAANSPSTTVTGPATVTLPGGGTGTVEVSKVASDVTTSATSFATASVASNATVLGVVSLNIAGASASDLTTGVSVVFNVPGVSAGDTVWIIQYVNGAWTKTLATSVANGTVTGLFHSLSPVGFVRVPAAAATTAAATTTAATASPKTGETNTMATAGIVALLGLVGAFVVIKKATAVKLEA